MAIESNTRFGERVREACQRNPKLPEMNYGLYVRIQEGLREYGVDVSSETVRKWYQGETVARRTNLHALAAVLGVDPAWLESGTSGISAIKPENINFGFSGAVNLTAGALQLQNIQVALAEPSFEGMQRAHFTCIYRGKQHHMHVAAARDSDEGISFIAPAVRANLRCLALVPVNNFAFNLYRLDEPVIEDEGDELGPNEVKLVARRGMSLDLRFRRHVINPALTVHDLFS